MPWAFTITLRGQTTKEHRSDMDFFQAQAKVLVLMGIKDAGPVLSNEDALKIAEAARKRADSVALRARK